MAVAVQLDLFKKMDAISMLETQVVLIDKKCSNVQRGLFARFSNLEENFNALWELCHNQRHEIERLKQMVNPEHEILEFSIPNPKVYKLEAK